MQLIKRCGNQMPYTDVGSCDLTPCIMYIGQSVLRLTQMGDSGKNKSNEQSPNFGSRKLDMDFLKPTISNPVSA